MTKMRITALLATAALLLGACAGAGPAATVAPSTEADIEITGPVTLTLWHALTSDPQKGALEAAVKKFNETNGKGITVTPVVQGK
jgi:ABC-type glycerol-3-phosphate transport system substrate-binding protein